MTDAADKFEGGCLCGAVRFIATGKPKAVYWCHCESCRKHSGAPASVFVAFEQAAYAITKGEIAKFDSTPGRTRRGFCARCGSTLTCESARLHTETHFYVGAFDRAATYSLRNTSLGYTSVSERTTRTRLLAYEAGSLQGRLRGQAV